MLDHLRTPLARLMAQRLKRPRPLVIQAWLWLAAEADTLEDKRLCLEAVVRLDPENEAASLALLLLDQRRPTS